MNYLIYIDQNSILKELELIYNKRVIDGQYVETWECTPKEDYIIIGVVLGGKLVDFNYPEQYDFNLTAVEMFLSKPNNANYVILDRYYRTSGDTYVIQNVFTQSINLGFYPSVSISITQLSVGVAMIPIDYKGYSLELVGYEFYLHDTSTNTDTKIKTVLTDSMPAQEILNIDYYSNVFMKVMFKQNGSINNITSNSVNFDETTPNEATPLVAITVNDRIDKGSGIYNYTLNVVPSNIPDLENTALILQFSEDGVNFTNQGETSVDPTINFDVNCNVYRAVRVKLESHTSPYPVYFSNDLEI